MDDLTKTPATVLPTHLWLQARKLELSMAINDYVKAEMDPPVEWIDEFRGMIKPRRNTI
jgi:hypothetical protein